MHLRVLRHRAIGRHASFLLPSCDEADVPKWRDAQGQMERPMTQNDTKVSVQAELERLTRRLLGAKLEGRRLSAEDSLVDAGLSSLDVVKLMLALEGEFDLTIPESELTPANFRTLATIENMLARLRPAA